MSIKVCKGIWRNHELKCYCNGFKDATPSDTTTTCNESVTCNDCKMLIEVENNITKEVCNG